MQGCAYAGLAGRPGPGAAFPTRGQKPTAGPMACASSLSQKRPKQPGKHAGSCFRALSPALRQRLAERGGKLMVCNCAGKEAPRGALRSSGRHPAWHGAVRGAWVPIPQSERGIAKSWVPLLMGGTGAAAIGAAVKHYTAIPKNAAKWESVCHAEREREREGHAHHQFQNHAAFALTLIAKWGTLPVTLLNVAFSEVKIRPSAEDGDGI